MALVVSLEHPLRQGATTYPHLVLQLPKEAPCEVTLNLEADELQRRFGDKLELQESGDMPDVFAKVRVRVRVA
jgi:structure-specific recognition protein 1